MDVLKGAKPVSVRVVAVRLGRDYMTVFGHLRELIAEGRAWRQRDPLERHGYVYGAVSAKRTNKRRVTEICTASSSH